MTLNTKKAVPKDLIDSLLADYKKPEDLIGENGLLKQLTKLLVERALDAEMSEHLGHDKNAPVTMSLATRSPSGKLAANLASLTTTHPVGCKLNGANDAFMCTTTAKIFV
jgi:hypothetical protein